MRLLKPQGTNLGKSLSLYEACCPYSDIFVSMAAFLFEKAAVIPGGIILPKIAVRRSLDIMR